MPKVQEALPPFPVTTYRLLPQFASLGRLLATAGPLTHSQPPPSSPPLCVGERLYFIREVSTLFYALLLIALVPEDRAYV